MSWRGALLRARTVLSRLCSVPDFQSRPRDFFGPKQLTLSRSWVTVSLRAENLWIPTRSGMARTPRNTVSWTICNRLGVLHTLPIGRRLKRSWTLSPLNVSLLGMLMTILVTLTSSTTRLPSKRFCLVMFTSGWSGMDELRLPMTCLYLLS